MILSQLGILLTWLTLAGAFIGLGAIVRRRLGRRIMTGHDRLVSIFLGMGIVIAVLEIWNFLWPINAVAELVILGPGLASLAVCVKPLLRGLWPAIVCRKVESVALLLVLLWMSNRAIMPPTLYDTKMYHLNAVRWATEYAAVPGVVNVQRNVAFNNASHLIAAMLNHGPWAGRSQHVCNGLFVVPLMAAGVWALGGLFRGKVRRSSIFMTLCLPIAFVLTIRPDIASLSTDLPVAVLAVVIIAFLMRFLAGFRRNTMADGVSLFAILFATTCCKLSAIGMVGAGVALTWMVLARSRGVVKTSAALLAVAILMTSGYLARGITMSGYPLFPLKMGGLNVEWKYPEADMDKLQIWIREYGRGASNEREAEATKSSDWHRRWWSDSIKGDRDRLLGPLALWIAAAGLWLVYRPCRDSVWLALIPALAGVMVWGWISPSLRFGFGFAWVLGALAVALVLPRRWRVAPAAYAGVASLYAVMFILSADGAGFMKSWGRLVVYPGPDHGLHPPTPTPYKPFVSKHGVTVYVPQSGDFIVDAPLPCSHIRNANLKEREPGNIARGFVTAP